MATTPETILPVSFYSNPDVVEVSRLLLGKVLCTKFDGVLTSGMITETEAYCGRNDKACHANNGTRTARTEVMYGKPGQAYIYLCYGIHHLFNVVTNEKNVADAVLIRSIRPIDGYETIRKRRNVKNKNQLTDGPGKLTQALGITTDYTSISLSGPPIWIEDRNFAIPSHKIEPSKRIGVEYAGEDADRLWRFGIASDFLKNF